MVLPWSHRLASSTSLLQWALVSGALCGTTCETSEHPFEQERQPLCVGEAEVWASDHRTCSSYSSQVDIHQACLKDKDASGLIAYQVCPECGRCLSWRVKGAPTVAQQAEEAAPAQALSRALELQAVCEDVVPASADTDVWHDSSPKYNCEWYESEESRCATYGDNFRNFGHTANEACCTCGGGSVLTLAPTPRPIMCIGDRNLWDASKGSCPTYARIFNENFDSCQEDHDGNYSAFVVCSECEYCEDPPGTHLNQGLNMNVYDSRSTMEENGWRIGTTFVSGDDPHIDEKCGATAKWWGWQSGSSMGFLRTVLKGSGLGRIEFGNCRNSGHVYAYLGEDIIAGAGPNENNVVVSFYFRDGDVLELRDLQQMSIISLTSVHISSVHHRCSPGIGHGEITGCCTPENPCPYGVGDCDSDDQCADSLTCSTRAAGIANGYESDSVDVCGQDEFTVSTDTINGWIVMLGPCQVHDGCVQSDNYPSAYSHSTECEMQMLFPAPIEVESFATEEDYDKLRVNGVEFHGKQGPQGLVPAEGSSVVWSSDNTFAQSGWRLCIGEITSTTATRTMTTSTLTTEDALEEDDTRVIFMAIAGGAALFAISMTGIALYCTVARRRAARKAAAAAAGKMNNHTLDPESSEALPQYWSNVQNANEGSFDRMVYVSRGSHEYFENLLRSSYRDKVTQDRPCPNGTCPRTPGGCACFRPGGTPGLPTDYKVRRVIRVEDQQMWVRYLQKRNSIRERRMRELPLAGFNPPLITGDVSKYANTFEPLDSSINECYLWHGTDVRSALRIAAEDFKINVHSAGMYGPGAYFAESSTKADEYSKDEPGGHYNKVFALLLCRVCMGKQYYTVKKDISAHEKIEQGGFDSTCGDRAKSADTFREFVIYNTEQIYPEYVVLYSRVYKGTNRRHIAKLCAVPYFMQVPVYWRNAHLSPIEDSFNEEHQVNRSTLELLQKLASFSCMEPGKQVSVLRARRLELSASWQRYNDIKSSFRIKLTESSNGTSSEKLAFSSPAQLDGHQESGQVFVQVHNGKTAEEQVISASQVDSSLNECWLWHGISRKLSEEIIADEFQVPEEGSDILRGARFGVGAYFAEDISKSLGYAVPHTGRKYILLCRVLCGDFYFTEQESEVAAERARDLEGKDSILANPHKRGPREYIVGNADQVYPEYIVEISESLMDVSMDPSMAAI